MNTPDTTPAEALFSPQEIEQFAFRRFNPLPSLNAGTLTSALDAFSVGELAPASRLWTEIARRDPMVSTLKAKREEAVSLQPLRVEPLNDSPEAADQVAVLEAFYQGVRAGHALDRHVTGGVARLIQQMMESTAFRYAAHHIRWQPNAGREVELPSGRRVPCLCATFDQVPLDLFEARTGELRFLKLDQYYTGENLAADQWMITSGQGLMFAASILHFYKRLATHDFVNFSEKFGTPSIFGQTTGSKDSDQGEAMRDAVRSLASNYRGVQYGAPENKIEFLWPSGGSSSTLPMEKIIESSNRDLAILFLGADLSTISRGDSVGASLQGDEQWKRTVADCARISETLQATIDPQVVRWYFGPRARVLAKVTIVAPDNEDREQLRKNIATAVSLGARVSVEKAATALGVPLADEGEDALTPAASPALAANVNHGGAEAQRKEKDWEDLDQLIATSADALARSLAVDFEPLAREIALVLDTDDEQEFRNRLAALRAGRAEIERAVLAGMDSTEALQEVLSAAVFSGLSTINSQPST